jgi:2-polyprenyl-3-methyl-5-hydroxy-6-metoxy-1,4-benzoquinol methylase
MHPNCRVCLSTNTVYLCETYNEHSKTSLLKHYRCAECGSVFVGNTVDSDELRAAYSTLVSTQYYEEIDGENRKKMAMAIGHLGELIPRSASIIDIGTGNGLFVEMLHKAGFTSVSAHEIPGADMSRITDIACNIYQDFDYSSIPIGRFDAVTLLDVVEHVMDPRYVLKMCSKILKENGVVYFHTPVVTKIDRIVHIIQKIPILRKIGSIWQRGRTSIFHLENYTQKALSSLLDEAGFGDIKIKTKNELSWPVTKYVRVYLLEKQGLPGCIAPILSPVFYPLLATDVLNPNKAVISARKMRDAADQSASPCQYFAATEPTLSR